MSGRAPTERPDRPRRRYPFVWGAVVIGLLLAACGEELPQNTLDPAGPNARNIDKLWNLVFGVAVVVGILVSVALIISIIRFRERDGVDLRRGRTGYHLYPSGPPGGG